MAKGVIGILTGGGDVPGLNPTIRAVTKRAINEGYRVIGIRNGWEGLININRDVELADQTHVMELTADIVRTIHRQGGTFLHSARTNPIRVRKNNVPAHLQKEYNQDVNDLTPEVLKNLAYLGIDHLIPIGGDDTLSYGVHLYRQGFKVVAIPKTMDNDIPGTDYCLGFSTCVTRTVEMARNLRTCAGSHERILVMEAFGRYAGFSALTPAMAGASDRVVIPEHKFNIEKLTELLVRDRRNNPSNYSMLLISEGAMFEGGEMVFESEQMDGFGHKKLGGIGDLVSQQIREISPKFNNGQEVQIINQRLGYLVRSGAPDATDAIVAVAYGNVAMNLINEGRFGRMVCMRDGTYDSVELDVITASKKVVNIEKFYNVEKYRPNFKNFLGKHMWI